MNELNKILANARARKLALANKAAGSASAFNLENPYSVTAPWPRWELSDIFAYSETGALAGAERPFKRWLQRAGLSTWRGASRQQQRQFLAGCVALLGAGYDDEAAQVLLYAMRGVECERSDDPVAEATRVAADVLDCKGSFLAIAHGLEEADDPCTALSLLLLLVTLCPGNAELAAAMASSPVGDHGRQMMLIDVLLAMLMHMDERSVAVRKTALLLWRVVMYTMGGPAEIDARKAQVRVASGLPARPGLKCRRADLEDMQRRLERLHVTATPPAALLEAMDVLQRSLHVPVAVLREADLQRAGGYVQRSRVVRKVVGSELKTSREHGSHDLNPFAVPREHGKRRCHLKKNITPFEEFYRRALPQLHKHVGAVVALLVAVLVDTANARDGSSSQSAAEQVDARRHNAVVAKSCASVLLLLLRLARESHPMQHEYLVCLYVDVGLMDLLLRFVQLDVAGLCLAPHWVPNAAIHYLFEEPAERPHVNWNFLVTTVSCMQLLQKLTKHSMLRVRAVKQHKADRDLKKLLQCHPTVRHYALKVLKSTMRLVKGKKRVGEGALITAIFMELTPDLNDDWMTSWYLEQDEAVLGNQELLVEVELRAEVAQFNAYHYNSRSTEFVYDDADDSSDDERHARRLERHISDLYAAADVGPHSFPDGVDAWLAANVYSRKPDAPPDPFEDDMDRYCQ